MGIAVIIPFLAENLPIVPLKYFMAGMVMAGHSVFLTNYPSVKSFWNLGMGGMS